jgi:hypothetical protein
MVRYITVEYSKQGVGQNFFWQEQCNNFRHTLVMDQLCPLHVVDFGVYALGRAPLPLTEESLEFPLHDAV